FPDTHAHRENTGTASPKSFAEVRAGGLPRHRSSRTSSEPCEPSLECGVLTPASATPGAPTPKCCADPQVWLLHPPTVALPGSAGYATAFFEPHLAVISYVPCHIILRSMECSVNENVATNTKQARLITAGPAWFTGGHFRRTISISLAHQGQYR